MDIDRFWELIERARAAAGPAANQAVRDYDEPGDDPDRDYWNFENSDLHVAFATDLVPTADTARSRAIDYVNGSNGHADLPTDEDGDDEAEDADESDEDDITDPLAAALFDLLIGLSAGEIAEFDNTFEDVRAKADRHELALAATLIEHGFLGVDSFDDFKAGLVLLGRDAFEAAVANPDSLADNVVVREIAAAHDPRWIGRDDLVFVASHAYATVTGEDEIGFYEFAEEHRADGDAHDGAPDEPDTADVDITNEAEVRRRLPRLAELFYERSLTNRKRAVETLGLRD
jgi:hypothetical protein